MFNRHLIPIAFAALTIGFFLIPLTRSEARRLKAEAAWQIARGEFAEAEVLSKKLVEISPDDPAAHLFAGEIASQEMQDREAIRFLEPLARTADLGIRQRSLFLLGERYFMVGEFWKAEQALRGAIELNPRDLKANKRLASILYMEGRAWEARPFLEERVRQHDFVIDEVVMLASSESWVSEQRIVRNHHDGEVLLELGRARTALLHNLNEDSLNLVQPVLKLHPELGEVQAVHGQALLRLGRMDDVARWEARLGKAALDHPEVWRVRAEFAQHRGDRAQAIQFFSEVLTRHPWHGVATYQLAQELFKLGEKDLADPLFERSRKITEIHTLAGELRITPDDAMTHKICGLLNEVGCDLEAAGWADMAQRFSKTPQEWEPLIAHHRNAGFGTVAHVPGLEEIRKLRIISLPAAETPVSTQQTTAHAQVQFANDAQSQGIQFNYDIGKSIDAGLEHIFETTGGGVAVIDFDSDGWPDLYFPQACEWRNETGEGATSDQFYRNAGGVRFQDVTVKAGIEELKFSQGVTSGDLNEDGLPDLYVCNLGQNACYLNNGDGTFSEVAVELGISSPLWSLSAAIADLNGDNLSDVYVVNYLDRQEVADRSCKHEGQPRSCAPTMFNGAQDRLFLNDGQGGFRDITEACGIVERDGKGLGVIVADFFDDGVPEIYVGNDTVANFFFVRQPKADSSNPVWANEAIARGLAYNEQGQVQATMGMAVADVNEDRLLDLFATNFYHDANTLYVQTPDHFFQEQTRRSNLYDSGFYMLGFGTQFIDADNDGQLDIAITNGHVDRTFATGEPDEMRPQFFLNVGDGKFVEQLSGVGAYFDEQMIGRGMAILDWNNDGRQDMVVTHLDQPAALVSNQTTTDNKSMQLTLLGRKSSRQPIGARIELELSSGRRILRQLTTGDGYEVRNEQRIHVGLGANVSVQQVTVTWPSGHQDTYPIKTPSRSWALVEAGKALPLP